MEEYYFISRNITEAQVKSIIFTADYKPGDYTYEELVDHDGYRVKGTTVMSLTRLRNAAQDLRIKVEISSPNVADEMIHTTALASDTVYRCDFQNDTPDTWIFAVYQTLPSSPGLQSVSWKQTTVPRNGESGVEWNINYLVAVANYRQDNGKGVYKATQRLGTSLGQRWETRMADGAQQLFENGSAPQKNQVVIDNRSGKLADLGIGMDGDIALIQPQVYSGNAAQFTVEPTYWVALFKDVVRGEIISGNQTHGPIQVKFKGGSTTLTYRASIDGQNFVFEEVDGERLVARLDEVEARAQTLRARAAVALTR